MRTLNSIINFSGVEYDPGISTTRMADIAVSIAMNFIDENKPVINVKLIGVNIADPASDIETNEDGSITIYGEFPSDGGTE